MTKFDGLALGVILITTLIAMMRGLVGEMASLLSWVVSFIVAKLFAAHIADIVFSDMHPRALAISLSFLLVFVVMLIVQRLFRTLITSFLHSIGLGGINRFFGACFGAAKGVIIVTLVVILCSFTDLPKTPAWRQSATAGLFMQLARVAVPYLPSFVVDKLSLSKIR